MMEAAPFGVEAIPIIGPPTKESVEDVLKGVDLVFTRGKEKSVISIRAEKTLPQVVNPWWYRYLEPTGPKAPACIQIIAGPGVSIHFEPDRVWKYPQVHIIRVQDARPLPPPNERLAPDEFLVPFVIPMDEGFLYFSDPPAPSELPLARPDRPLPRDLRPGSSRARRLICRPQPDGMLFTSLEARQSIRVEVPLSKNELTEKPGTMFHDIHVDLDDESARFAWEWRDSTLIIVKTPGVTVTLLDEHPIGILAAFQSTRRPEEWWRIVEVDTIEQVPADGSLANVTGRPGTRGRLGPTGERILDGARLVLDLALNFIPVVGTGISLYEAVVGSSIWGEKLPPWQRGIAGLSLALPHLGRGAEGVKALTALFGDAIHEAMLLDQLTRVGGRFPAQAVRDAGLEILGRGSGARYTNELLKGLSELPPMSGRIPDLINATGDAFRSPMMQAGYVAAKRASASAIAPRQFLTHGPIAGRAWAQRRLGNYYDEILNAAAHDTSKFGRPITLSPEGATAAFDVVEASYTLHKSLGTRWPAKLEKAKRDGEKFVKALLKIVPAWVVNRYKGTIAEALALPRAFKRMTALAKDERYVDKTLILATDLHTKSGSKVVEYADIAIGYLENNKFILIEVIEVKSGLKGFTEGVEQLTRRLKATTGELIFGAGSKSWHLHGGIMRPIPLPFGARPAFQLASDAKLVLTLAKSAAVRPLATSAPLARRLLLDFLDVDEPGLLFLVRRVLEKKYLPP